MKKVELTIEQINGIIENTIRGTIVQLGLDIKPKVEDDDVIRIDCKGHHYGIYPYFTEFPF